jgi:hypothetical protein
MKANILMILLFSLGSFCFTTDTERPYCLEISGRVSSSSLDKSTTYKVILMKDSVVVDSLELPEKQAFQLKLKRKQNYCIKIAKKGFIDRFIVVKTNIDNNKYSNDRFLFKFDLDLADAEDFQGISKKYFDPVIIRFNNKNGWFSYNGPGNSKERTCGFEMEIGNVFQCK